jgi:hypothetical protein
VLKLMTDNRFKNFPVDARFPTPGADVRWQTQGVDGRFQGGLDTRFQGSDYGQIASFGVTLTGLATDSLGTYGQVGSHASIGFTTTPVITPDEVKWSASASTGAAATFGTGANPTDFTAADGFLVYLHVRRDAEWVTRSFSARRAAGAFGALTNQSFTDDTGNQTYVFPAATGTGLTWTYTLVSPPSGVTINSGTRTITFDTNALAVQSGTVITVRATDQYGRIINQTFTLTIIVNSAVNPDFTGLVFADPGNATPDTLTATYTYSGADTLRAFVAIRNGGSALTAAQLRDGTGTFLERVVVNPFSATTFDLTGFTATSNAGTAVDMAIGEVANGGLSAVQTTAVTGLDFTAPTFSSGSPADNATDVAVGSNLALTFSEAIFAGTGVFTLRNTSAGSTVETFNIATGVGSAGGTISIAGAVVTINPGADLLGSTNYSVRWDAGVLLDGDGNPLAVNTGDTLYNFTTAAAGVTYTLGATPAYLGSSTADGATLFSVTSSGAARKLIVEIMWESNIFDSLTFNGVTNTTPILSIGPDFCRIRVYVFDVPGGVSGAVTINRAGGVTNAIRLRYGFVGATDTVTTPVSQVNLTNNQTLDASQAVAAGSVVLVGHLMGENTGAATRTLNWTGSTNDFAWTLSNFMRWQFARKTISSSGTETITSTNTGESGSQDKALYSIEVTP